MVVSEDPLARRQDRKQRLLRARARIELDRRRSRSCLRTFTRLYQPKYRDAPHLSQLDDSLDRSLIRLRKREGIGVIVLEAPPRHFKTSRIMAHMARVL